MNVGPCILSFARVRCSQLGAGMMSGELDKPGSSSDEWLIATFDTSDNLDIIFVNWEALKQTRK